MMNYIKSEFYRIFHGREIYRFIIILALLAFSFNAVLAWFRRMDDFPYGITSYSYSNLVASPLIFGLMGTVVGMILYEGNRRNGNLKNTVAFGISRTKIFISECIVTTIISLISMVIILAVYIGSAVMLLEQAGPVELNDLLTEVPAVFLIAVALFPGLSASRLSEKVRQELSFGRRFGLFFQRYSFTWDFVSMCFMISRCGCRRISLEQVG